MEMQIFDKKTLSLAVLHKIRPKKLSHKKLKTQISTFCTKQPEILRPVSAPITKPDRNSPARFIISIRLLPF